MLQIPSHQRTSTSGSRTLQENVVIRIDASPHTNSRENPITAAPYRAKHIRDFTLGSAQPRPPHYFLILRVDSTADAKLGIIIENRPKKYRRRRPRRVYQSRNQDISIQNDPNLPATECAAERRDLLAASISASISSIES